MNEVTIHQDRRDPGLGHRAVTWAIDRLRRSLAERDFVVRELAPVPPDASERSHPGASVLVGTAASAVAAEALHRARVTVPDVPEALGLVPSTLDSRPVLVACGSDPLGLVYAVTELADRVDHAPDPLSAFRQDAPIVQRPANAIRSVTRLFTSEVEDAPWFCDEAFWREYLSELVAQRLNRFSLTLGLGYNFHRHVTDAYLYFPYPFLVSVSGHDVRVPQLPDDERERNLRTLRFVSDEAAARGLRFQLGLWNHAYEWLDSPEATHTIEGLTPRTHAEYCRDAVQMLLEECPSIAGLTFRIHGEGGIPEGSWSFWKTVFDGVARSGRAVEIDLHSKGLDRQTLDAALGTGLPVTVSPKFWAEHMGLPYHQTAIRELERPPRVVEDMPATEWHRHMTVSEGSRPFTRYGYADLLREERPYGVYFRLWPGTQRVLLWGDPAMAAAYARASGIAGSLGMEWCEPLTFKGREGTGLPGGRDGYADASLRPADGDWAKYRYAYRLLGRSLYDPDEDPQTWRRYLRTELGDAADEGEAALASASRILPLVTTAHHPSASNNYFWPELYTNMPIVADGDETRPQLYIDTPVPRRFGTVGALDPELFSTIAEFVDETIADTATGRYSPIDVAGWLDELAVSAREHLVRMREATAEPEGPAVRRWSVDVAIQASLGRFFAAKLRAGVRYERFRRAGNGEELAAAIAEYRAARAAWAEAAATAGDVYVPDLTFGPQPWLRGHWSDRLAAIDEDVADMLAELSETGDTEAPPLERTRPTIDVRHTPPESFRRGDPIAIDASVPSGVRAMLRYRHVNQAEEYRVEPMSGSGGLRSARIPGEYTDSPYPIQYRFVLRQPLGSACVFPGLGPDLCGRPYFLIPQATGASRV